jgi:hypothetical protein
VISTSERKIDKSNTRFNPEFLDTQGFKMPKPPSKGAREVLGLYMPEKKREVKQIFKDN